MTTKEERCDYRIEEVAARTGFTKRTLRYYEEIGLITPAGRSEGNYRLYSEADVARLQRIKRPSLHGSATISARLLLPR